MPKSQYLYISSKNRDSSDKKYNFRVNLNNPIVCNSNEGINVSVIGFSMLNTDYNCKGLTFSFQEIHFAPINYSILHTVNIPDGNYNYLSLVDLLNSKFLGMVSVSYIRERNTFLFTNIMLEGNVVLIPNNCTKIFGISSNTTIITSIEGSFINLVNYSHIIIKSNNLDFEDSSQDNISYKNNSLGISNILFIMDKQDIQPFQLISYRNYDKSDNFCYNINNNMIHFIDLMIYNEKNEILTDIDDYILILKFTINKKEISHNTIPLLEDIRFLIMSYLFSNKNKIGA